MKTTITRRNFIPLILLIISVIACYISLTNLTGNWKSLFDQFYEFTSQYKGNFYDTETYRIFDAKFKGLNLSYAITLAFFSLILFMYIFATNVKEFSIFFASLYLIFSWAIITNFKFDNIDVLSAGDYKNNLNMMLLLFSPYLYFTIRDTFIGKKEDITSIVLDEKRTESKKTIDDLLRLREQEIISPEQFSEKANNILKEQLKTEFLVTD